MPRFYELVGELEKRFPTDWWIVSRRESARILDENSFPQIAIYDRALCALDDDSWTILSERAIEVFSEPKRDRGKSQFFNLLNEALAYEYLILNGFNSVRLLRANSKNKSPDICCSRDFETRYCEVKTIGVSGEELARIRSEEVFSSAVYSLLGHQFFEKLRSTICAAKEQMDAVKGNGIVYLIVHFDDFALDHYDTYKNQITEFLALDFPGQEVVVRVNIDDPRYIFHCCGENICCKL
jgi:hypothetical protein